MTRIRSIRLPVGAHPMVLDAGGALVLTGVMLAMTRSGASAAGLTLACGLPLALRRRVPVTVLAVCVAALGAYALAGYRPGLQQLGAALALLSLAGYTSRRVTVAAAVVFAPVLAYSDVRAWNASPVAIAVLSTAWVATIWIAGDAWRRLREHNAVAAENAVRWRGEQRDREQQAVLLERVHIARELHDVVAHHMSVIAVQAGLARYVLSSDPQTSERALRAVAEMSSEGLAEVRRLVTVLRPDTGPAAGQEPCDQDTPGVDQLPILIERVGLAGVAIEFTVSGTTQTLPAGVGLCLYRVVQESLTNAIKHAQGARVTVLLHYAANEVVLRVTNDARGAGGPRPAPALGGGGKGLTGMYERAMLYGGTLSAGGLAHGGFEVVLTLPIRAVSAAGRANDRGASPAGPPW